VGELESYLPYDTYGMRRLAGTLQQQAGTLGTAAGEIDGAAAGMQFEAPAGDRIRHELAGASKQLTGAADGLNGAARQLLASAQQIDEENAAIARHNQRVLDTMPPLERKLVMENR
jgi:hypothetical protein